MGLRRHQDGEGRVWNVWDIPARFSPKRSGKDRRTQPSSGESYERRRQFQRRVTIPPPEWVHGWVCFENGEEKRRLCPMPESWEHASAEELEELRQQAVVVHHR